MPPKIRRTSSLLPPPRVLNDSKIKEYGEVFQLFDRDGDGFISAHELVMVLRTVGQDPGMDTAQRLLARYDTDHSGGVDFRELLAVLDQLAAQAEPEQELIDVFRVIDQDGDGYISKADLRQVVVSIGSRISNADIEEMVAEADKDGDGLIEFEEFAKIIQSRC